MSHHGMPSAVNMSRRTALGGIAAIGATALALRLGPHGQVSAQSGTPVITTAIEDYPEVVITATEYHLDLPTSIPAGPTRLTLKNAGSVGHNAMFLRVNEGTALAELQAALAMPDFGPIFAASTSFGGPEVDPGLQATTIVDLAPGQYVVMCILPDDEGMPHYLMGMQTPVEVTEAANTMATPAAESTVALVDFGFEEMPMQVASGRRIWEVSNVGEQIHELLIMRLSPGVSFDDVRAMLDLAPAATPETLVEATPDAAEAAGPPFMIVAGAAPMSPGQTAWPVLDLEAGEHFTICYLPDPATGAPHFALGMIMPLAVS
jgi:hypothetical protein